MRILDIKKCTIADGPGIRLSIYCSGCDLHCKGCHNQEAWDFNQGTDYKELLDEIISELEKSYYKGITFCGGEPLNPKNVDGFLEIAKLIKEKLPTKDIWCYTGYEWEDVKDLEIMKYIDVAVVGPFILEQRDISDDNRWRGSKNQRVIDVRMSLAFNTKLYLAGIPNNGDFVPFLVYSDYFPNGMTDEEFIEKFLENKKNNG